MPDGILRSAYEALGRGEARPLLELLPDRFEWVEPDLPGYPLAGVHRGSEGFAAGVLTPLAELFDGLTVELVDVMVDGRREVLTGVMRGTPAGTAGEEWELPFAHVWEVDDGAPVSGRAYFDRSRLTLAAGRRQLADMADELLEQAAEIRLQWSRLGDALRAAGVEVADDAAADEDPGELAAAGASSARLIAVDMAHDGRSRDEVDAYLREELGVEDRDAILDEAFDAEGEPAAAVAVPEHATPVDPSRLSRLFVRHRG